MTSGLSLIFQVREQQGEYPPASSPISPRHHQLTPDSSEMWAAIMRNSTSPQCQHFPLGALTNLCKEAGAKMGCQGQACYNLISAIVGHYVNCTSRLQFLRHASSVLTWLMFGKQGTHFSPILYLCREGQLSMLFSQQITPSHSHVEAAQSTTVCHQENAQPRIKVSISGVVAEYLDLPSPPMFPETHGNQTGNLLVLSGLP